MSSPLPDVARLNSDRFQRLQQRLIDRASRWKTCDDWPSESLEACRDAGVFRWFHRREFGGAEWCESDVLRGYRSLAASCLTTAFVLTQRSAACQRIERGIQDAPRERWLAGLVSGEISATVGISQLTTSHRHVAPTLTATRESGGWRWKGTSPWVTGGHHAHLLVLGASLEDGRQLLAVIPTNRPGVEIGKPWDLLALSASGTGPVHLHDVPVADSEILAGPIPDVMRSGSGGGTGGLATSALAIGLAESANRWLANEAQRRPELQAISDAFLVRSQAFERRVETFLSDPATDDLSNLRHEANDIVLLTTQAALAAAKGAGFVSDHPVGRWAREALFFLVWSCPQGVLQAHLCDWAGVKGV